jgi:hypothetical protein
VIVSDISENVSPTVVRTRSCATSWRRCSTGNSQPSGANTASVSSARRQS